MSVAFRRESDEEHKEPKFELPIPAGPNLVTRRGLAMIDARVRALEASLVDLSDEAAEAARRDLRYWHTRRTTAQLTGPPADGSAGFATIVTIRMNDEERILTIVGDDEADPSEMRIAWSAPLARALAGAEAGETVEFNGRPDAIRIISIRPIEDD